MARLDPLFCQATREFFQVDGAYFWQRFPPDELVGVEADGLMAERFRGARLRADQSAVAIGRHPQAAEDGLQTT